MVDLAWLRATAVARADRRAPSIRAAAAQPICATISKLDIRHHPDSAVAGLLLCGWLASRLGWKPEPLIARDGER